MFCYLALLNVCDFFLPVDVSGFGASGPGAIVTTSRDVVAANRGIAPSQDIAATNRIQSNRSASSRDRIAANGGQAKVQQDDVSVISSAANSVDREHRVMAKRMVARSAAPPARPVTPPRPDQSRPITVSHPSIFQTFCFVFFVHLSTICNA